MQTAQTIDHLETAQWRTARREATGSGAEPASRPGVVRSLVAARGWLALPLVLGLLGLLAGLGAGFAARPSAEALLVVKTTATDGAGIQLGVKSAAVELNTLSLYEQAGSAAAVDPADLQVRTQIAAVPDSQLVSVTVTASSPAEAVRQADAVVEAALSLAQARTEAELRQVTGETRDLITDQRLGDANAERARVERLGDSLGSTQSGLVVGSREVTLLQPAQDVRMVPSALLLGAMGLIAGALLGLAAAIWLATRQGTVRSAKAVRTPYPDLPVTETDDLEGVLAADQPHGGSLFVGGQHRRSATVSSVAELARDHLGTLGREARLSDSMPTGVPAPDAPLSIVPVALNPGVLRRIAQNEDNMVIVVVEPRATTLQALVEIAAALPLRSYVLVAEPSAAEPAPVGAAADWS